MKSQWSYCVCAAVLSAIVIGFTPSIQAQDAGEVHIQGDNAGFPWAIQDGEKKNWDISADGKVTSGTNGAYNGGMILTVNNAGFAPNGSAKLSKDHREIEIGPWNWNGANLNISRRVYVDPKLGYCRWIDIFENNTGSDQTINVQYVTNHPAPIKEVLTSSGGKQIDPKKDFAYAAILNDPAKPVNVHVYANRGAKETIQPQFNPGAADIHYNYALTVPNGKAAAICLFESQQADAEKAKAFMKDFDPQIELAKAPAALRKLVVNIIAPRLMLESIELPRNSKLDLVVQPDGNELMGTITTDKFTLDTLMGKIELPAAKVLGLNVPSSEDPYVQLVLVDGQVIAGKLGAALTLKLENGNDQVFPPDKINFKSASFRISPERPQEIAVISPLLVLRSGQRLAFNPADVNCVLRSVYGDLKIDPAQIASIATETSDGALHRVTFRNGSIVSGLISPDKFTFKLQLGMPLEMGLQRMSRLEFAPVVSAGAGDLCRASLRNDDELLGKLLDEAIDLQTENGKITLKPADVSTIEFGDEVFGHAEVKLRSGRAYTGKVLNRSLKFKIEPGPELNIPVGMLTILNLSGAAIVPAAAPTPVVPVRQPNIRTLPVPMRKGVIQMRALAVPAIPPGAQVVQPPKALK